MRVECLWMFRAEGLGFRVGAWDKGMRLDTRIRDRQGGLFKVAFLF